MGSRRPLRIHPAPGDRLSQQLGKCREGRIPPDKEKQNKVRSNWRKRLCGRFGLLSPLEAACFHFKTAVVSGHQTVCSSSRGWVVSRGVTRVCRRLLPEFSRTGLLAQLLRGALSARLAGVCVEVSSSKPGPQVAECGVRGFRLLGAQLSQSMDVFDGSN